MDVMKQYEHTEKWRQGRVAEVTSSVTPEEPKIIYGNPLAPRRLKDYFADGYVFDDPQDLELARDNNSGYVFPHRVIVLEDLEGQRIEILGLGFNIPPYFFALHWCSPVDFMNDEAYLLLGQDPKQHFILSYQEIFPLMILRKKIRITMGVMVLPGLNIMLTAFRHAQSVSKSLMGYTTIRDAGSC
jgi:hypothetical protein